MNMESEAMSLDFNYKSVKKEFALILANADRPGDYKKGDKILHPVMSAMVWRLMAIGVTRITEENAEEVFWRSCFFETLWPDVRMNVPLPAPFDGHEQRSLSLQDVKNLIGLSTNVSSETRAQWKKRMVAQYIAEVERRADKMQPEDIYPIYREKFPDCIVSE